MNLYELTEPTPTGYYNEEDDNTVLKLSDLRKTKLTLKQLNRLRVMNDVRKLEHEQKIEKVAIQYAAPPAESAMPA